MSEFVLRVEGVGDSERVAQLEEIVRCRDCAHQRLEYGNRGHMFCMRNSCSPWLVEPDGFCKWGERGEDANA